MATAVALAGMGAGTFLPVTGLVLAGNSEKFGRAVVRLAQSNPAVLRALKQASNATPWLELAQIAAAVAVAVAVDSGAMPADALPAQYLGVTEAAEMIAEQAEQQPPAGTFGPPPAAQVA